MRFIYKDWGEEKTNSSDGDIGKQIILDTEGEWFMCYNHKPITIDNYEKIYAELKQADNGCKATAKSYITNSDGQRIIWFDKITIEDGNRNLIQRCTIEGIDNRGHTIKKHIGPLDHNHHKSMLYEWLGVVDHFQGGRMYYAAPVENVKNTQKNYGVIRNTWYQVSLADITGIGYPVDDPTEPIVPNKTTQQNKMTFNVEILGWHTVEKDLPF